MFSLVAALGVEPDRFYTLYGDATEQRFEASTSRKLFVKLERRQFAALFGDFETGLTLTELTRYSRTFTGLKSDYAGEHFGYSAFAAESEQGYVKDELQGDGTSGLYRLSRRPIILNSDKIRLEVRDRFRSEVVVESRPLSPFVDYSIDYLNGTLFFKQPVPSRDASFNPVYIIAEYEILNGGEQQLTAGGRASMKLADDRVELGASFIQEGAAAGDTSVAGTAGTAPMNLQDHLDRVEREAILDALEKTRFNRTAAAKLLGITFRALRYRMARLGLNEEIEPKL